MASKRKWKQWAKQLEKGHKVLREKLEAAEHEAAVCRTAMMNTSEGNVLLRRRLDQLAHENGERAARATAELRHQAQQTLAAEHRATLAERALDWWVSKHSPAKCEKCGVGVWRGEGIEPPKFCRVCAGGVPLHGQAQKEKP